MASFEHFKAPLAAVRECARVTAPGGLGLHRIDFRDHRDFSKPLLRYEGEAWERLHAGTFWYTNRLRKGDFESAFATSDLAVRSVKPSVKAPCDATARAALAPRFRERSADDLEVLSALFAVEKA